MVQAIALRAGTNDYFVRPPGNPKTGSLGTGHAIFMGGVTSVSAQGDRRSFVHPTSILIWPSWVVGIGALTVVAIWLALPSDSPMLWPLCGTMIVIFVVATVGAYMKGFRSRKNRLVLDAQQRCCVEMDGSRPVMTIPFDLFENTRVQLYADRTYTDVFEVLLNLGFAELQIHQDYSKTAAVRLAQEAAQCLGIPFDPTLQRKA